MKWKPTGELFLGRSSKLLNLNPTQTLLPGIHGPKAGWSQPGTPRTGPNQDQQNFDNNCSEYSGGPWTPAPPLPPKLIYFKL